MGSLEKTSTAVFTLAVSNSYPGVSLQHKQDKNSCSVKVRYSLTLVLHFFVLLILLEIECLQDTP